MYSLESPRWRYSDENTQHTFMLKKRQNTIPIMSPVLALWLTLISSNYHCLERIFMFQSVWAIEVRLYFRCPSLYNFTVFADRPWKDLSKEENLQQQQIMYQQKIFSDQIRKSAITQVFIQGQFQRREKLYALILMLLIWNNCHWFIYQGTSEHRPYMVSVPKCPGKWLHVIKW